MDATPVKSTTTKTTTVNAIAKGFVDDELVKLGKYMVTRLVDGWDTLLTFTAIDTGKTYSKRIASDGPTHAAEQAYSWWTTDAWYL